MNVKHMSKTQLKLINTAGPLFAEDGLKGTRIRSITERAGVNIAGINYHFGSKEKLYQAVVSYVFEEIDFTSIAEYWNNLPEENRHKKYIDKMLGECLSDIFYRFFKSDHPIWYFKILQKEISSPTESTKLMNNRMYEEDLMAAHQIIENIKSKPKKWEAEAWLALCYSQFLNLSLLMPSTLQRFQNNSNTLDTEYVDAIIENNITAVLAVLYK